MSNQSQRRLDKMAYEISYPKGSPKRLLNFTISLQDQDKQLKLEPKNLDFQSPIQILTFVNILRKDGEVGFSIYKELIKTYRKTISERSLISVKPFDGMYRNSQIPDDELNSLGKLNLHGAPTYTEKNKIANMILQANCVEYEEDIERLKYFRISITGKISN